jgi:hypothetical protein
MIVLVIKYASEFVIVVTEHAPYMVTSHFSTILPKITVPDFCLLLCEAGGSYRGIEKMRLILRVGKLLPSLQQASSICFACTLLLSPLVWAL